MNATGLVEKIQIIGQRQKYPACISQTRQAGYRNSYISKCDLLVGTYFRLRANARSPNSALPITAKLPGSGTTL
jgi:hypothetical protein